jgi:alginate O-acetyltransferase complex protein AlgI
MTGFVLIFHFGLLDLIARLWRAIGFKAEPVMDRPMRSTSLAEFWGARWNLPFRDLAHACVFAPLVRRIGPAGAMMAVFLASGLIHDVVISLPARAGFGLPTAYFLLQGAAVLFERSRFGKRVGLGRGVKGWLFTALFTLAPVYWLFHPWFVARVALPMMRDLGAL